MHKERRRCFIDFCLQTGETRVWRTYVGGARLNEWHGRKAEQGFFPEDWAASTTRAVNAGREDLIEGLSRVVSMPDQPYLLDLIQKDPEAFFGMVIYKELNWETLMKTLKDSVKDITVITIILAFSGVFGYGVVFDDLATTIASALVSITTKKTLLLFLVILFLLLCGMFMETTVIALILTPILLPVMQNVGVDPVVFGMIMMTCVTFGVMTQPVGTGLYTVSDIMGCSIQETVRYGWPFYVAVLLVVVFMVFFPDAVLWLPNLVYGA